MYLKSSKVLGPTNLTLVEDDGVTIYQENLNTPGAFVGAYTPILNSARAISSTVNQREYIALSDLVEGQDQPRQYDGTNFDRISQVGPGVGPAVTVSNPTYPIASISEIYPPNLTINSVSWGAVINIKTGQFPGAGYTITFLGNSSDPSFTAGLAIGDLVYINPGTSATVLGGASPGGTYAVTAIGTYYDGSNTHYYFQVVSPIINSNNIPINAYSGYGITYQRTPALVALSQPIPLQNAVVGANISIAGNPISQWNATWKIVATPTEGQLSITGTSLTSNVATFDYILQSGEPPGWQPAFNFPAAGQIVAPSGDVWQVALPGLSGGTIPSDFLTPQTIGTTVTADGGVNWVSIATGGGPVQVLATVFNTTNGNGIFNIQQLPITSATSTSFTVAITAPNVIAGPEEGQAIAGSGLFVVIDPGTVTLSSGNPGVDPIYGTYGSPSMGGFALLTSNVVAAGERYAVLMFLTRNGYITPASPPVSFYTTGASGQITFSALPIGPPDVIARIVAITLANAGAGGPYFWVPDDVTVLGSVASLGATQTFNKTVIDDNTSTQFPNPVNISDSILSASQNISVAGNNLQQQRELGECVKVVQFAGRCFYMGERVKNDQFLNMTFDGGLAGATFASDIFTATVNPSNGNTLTVGGVVYTWVTSLNNAVANEALIGSLAYPLNIVESMLNMSAAINATGVGAGTQYSSPTVPNPLVGVVNQPLGITARALLAGVAGNAIATASSNGSNLWTNHALGHLVGGSAAGFPAGWTITPALQPYISVISAPPFEQLLYIYNTSGPGGTINPTGTTLANMECLYQSAYETAALNAPIIQPNTAYSVRIIAEYANGAASTGGNLVVELYSPSLNTSWSFTISRSSLATSLQEFTGAFNNPLWETVPPDLQLRIYPYNLADLYDLTVYRLEVFPTQQPVYTQQVAASYIENAEAIDGVTGAIDISVLTSEPIQDHYVFLNKYYIATKSHTFSPIQNSSGEPDTWQVEEISNAVGSLGPLANDVGSEYVLTADYNGADVFDGGNHYKITQEIQQIWDSLYEPSKKAVWILNDLKQQRILIGVPLPTPNQWLPNAPTNATPATPNVILMCSYLGLMTGAEIATGHSVFPSAFSGMLLFHDMKRKWTIWNIASPMASWIVRPDGSEQIWFGQSGNGVSELNINSTNDNGTPIAMRYVTYGFGDSPDRERLQLGLARVIYPYALINAVGIGHFLLTGWPETFGTPANPNPYPFTQPAFPLALPALDDVNVPLNITGNRVFLQMDASTGSGLTVDVTASGGHVTGIAIHSGSTPTNYMVGDLFFINTGDGTAQGKVLTMATVGGVPGIPQTIGLVTSGATGYTTTNNVPTTIENPTTMSVTSIDMAISNDPRFLVTGK